MTRKLWNSIYYILIFLLFISCAGNKQKEEGDIKDQNPLSYQTFFVKMLIEDNMILIKKAHLVDNDIASVAHYEYADSLLEMVVEESGDLYFRHSLAKVYNAGTHVFLGMSYTRTLMQHAEYPVMNFFNVRRNMIGNSDSLLNAYVKDENPLNIIKLKNLWIKSITFFFKMNNKPSYDVMKESYDAYLAANDSILKMHNNEEAFKIINLLSEKELFKQVTILVIDIVKAKGNNDKEELNQLYQKLHQYASFYNQLPKSGDVILSTKPEQYYLQLYYSGTVIYKLFEMIGNRI